MLKWEIKNGDDKLRKEIEGTKNSFDKWYESSSWSKTHTKEEMLSENSPLEHVYYKMMKSFDEVKEKYPYKALECCSSCEKYVDRWMETSFSFCNEYDCRMVLCKVCANKIKEISEKI